MKKAVELSPRNDSYLYNLASLYMANRKPDDAIPVFEALTRSSEPALAEQAAHALAQARQFKEYAAKGRVTESGLIVRGGTPPPSIRSSAYRTRHS